MKCGFTRGEWRRRLCGLSYVLLGLVQAVSAQFVEVTVQIEEASSGSSRAYDCRCIFGTNTTWMIEGVFAVNAETTWWSTDTNIIRRDVITKKAPPSEGAYIASTPPEVGEEFVKAYGPAEECPLSGVSYLNWLAFCSGAFLKEKGRHLMPLYPGLGNKGPYADRTQSFQDALGLPERVVIYRGDGKLVCAYEVQQSTNFSGCTIPVRFTATQYDLLNGGTSEPVSALTARVTSVREAAVLVVPAEILKRPHP